MTTDNHSLMFQKRLQLLKRQTEYIKINTYTENNIFYKNLVSKAKSKYGNFVSNSINKKKLYFADGPIGSGKSTLMRNFIKYKNIDNLLYYSPEIYINFCESNSNFINSYNKSKKILWENAKKRLNTGESFIIESVFTKDEKIGFLIKAKKNGYTLFGIFVGTDTPDINVIRVNQRIKEGSYSIPEEKIYDRYFKSMKNLVRIFKLSDEMLVINNSNRIPKLIAYKFNNETYITENFNEWSIL